MNFPYFWQPIDSDLTVLRDRVSDSDEILTRNRPIMGLRDAAHAIDLA